LHFLDIINREEDKTMTDNITSDETLDCKGLSCPMPILKTKKAIGKMNSGQIIEVLSTDPGTKNDLPAFAKRGGHEYLGEKEDEGFSRFFIKVK
jgi:tRNA 2-thiouridine synthesizing protein A